MTASRIIPAHTPEHLDTVRELFREYQDDIGLNLCFQGFKEELATLPGKYAPTAGGLFLGVGPQGQAAGCIAFRPLDLPGPKPCEMKRLFVRPAYRGSGLGAALVDHIVAQATKAGYARMLLDTDPHLTSALKLYLSRGFVPTERYNTDPHPETMFFTLDLPQPASQNTNQPAPNPSPAGSDGSEG
ncbi:MAG: GNAT family N-acetyltransferase [Phycisphaerales bacterium]|nr:GNAT family N-acetyltransferase [Phycisphaerales bacterium]